MSSQRIATVPRIISDPADSKIVVPLARFIKGGSDRDKISLILKDRQRELNEMTEFLDNYGSTMRRHKKMIQKYELEELVWKHMNTKIECIRYREGEWDNPNYIWWCSKSDRKRLINFKDECMCTYEDLIVVEIDIQHQKDKIKEAKRLIKREQMRVREIKITKHRLLKHIYIPRPLKTYTDNRVEEAKCKLAKEEAKMNDLKNRRKLDMNILFDRFASASDNKWKIDDDMYRDEVKQRRFVKRMGVVKRDITACEEILSSNDV